MNRFDRLFQDIRDKTERDVLRWDFVDSDLRPEIILDASRVRRSFEAEYRMADSTYRLLFVEKKFDIPNDFGESSEGVRPEIYVIDPAGHPVVTLYDGVVDRMDLLRFSGLIADHNEGARSFFEAFEAEQTGAA